MRVVLQTNCKIETLRFLSCTSDFVHSLWQPIYLVLNTTHNVNVIITSGYKTHVILNVWQLVNKR